MTRIARLLAAGFALLGLGASAASSYVHYRLLTDQAYSSFCDVSAAVSCTGAYLSPYGSVMGVPVAVAGIVFFAVILLLATITAAPGSGARDTAAGYILVLSLAGLAFSAYLARASWVLLGVFCILCTITYVAVIGIFVVALRAGRSSLPALASGLLRDLRALVRSPRGLGAAAVLLAGSAALVLLFPSETPRPVQAQATFQALGGEERANLEAWWKVQPQVDLPVSPGSGVKVHIVMFSDYQCPACRGAHDALRGVVARHRRPDVDVTLKHYPLEGECNPAAAGSNHYAACEAAAAYVMARATDSQQRLDDWLFANQPRLTPAVVRQAAKEVAGIADFDGQYAAALKEVRADVALGDQLKVQATPTVYLNRRMIAGKDMGLPPAPYLDALIDIELTAAR